MIMNNQFNYQSSVEFIIDYHSVLNDDINLNNLII